MIFKSFSCAFFHKYKWENCTSRKIKRNACFCGARWENGYWGHFSPIGYIREPLGKPNEYWRPCGQMLRK